MLPVAILCGGKGTRIAAVAGDLPKALVPVAGEPFLAHQLRWLHDAGATDVVLLTGYRGDRIRAFAGDGAAFGLRIAYSDDAGVPRGTAGAIVRAIPLLGEAFLTVYGDAILSADPAHVEDALRAPYDGVMTVFRNEDRWQRSNVRTAGERVAAYDKHAPPGTMTHIDYGINAFYAADVRARRGVGRARRPRAGAPRADRPRNAARGRKSPSAGTRSARLKASPRRSATCAEREGTAS